MTNYDYIETLINKTIHISVWFSNTALCGAALVGRIGPRKEAQVNCPQCKAAR